MKKITFVGKIYKRGDIVTIAKTIRDISGINKADRLFWILLFIWIFCDMFQAIHMEVMSDEAYYALYGQYLAWGYYDHPPMDALINFLSKCLFSGNLSVRFINVLMHAGTVWIVWKMLPGKKSVLHVLSFFAIATSFIMFSAYGFITTPDGPLLFFAAAFLFFYKRFLEKESWQNTLFLTLSMVGMFYSKYHAVLVVGFVVLSNLRLLLKPKFWFCIFTTILLFLPHIYWQVSNNFPSFRYHLVGRSEGFVFINLLKYFPEQFVVFNPVALTGVLYILIKKKQEGLFDRALYFLISGFLFFFQVMTLKGRVEPHWTVVATLPMIIVLYKVSLQDPRFGKIFLKSILWTLPLILVARVLLVANVLPESFALNGKEKRYLAIEKVAGSLPVVFDGSFQDPSLYRFFTRREAFTVSSPSTRTTQFDIWGFDKLYQDSAAFIFSEIESAKKYNIDGKEFSGFKVQHLQTTNQVRIRYSGVPDKVCAGDTLRIHYTMMNPYLNNINMEHLELPVEFCSVYNGPDYVITTSPCFSTPELRILKASETIEGDLLTVVPAVVPDSEYLFGLSLKTSICIPYNSPYQKIEIIEK